MINADKTHLWKEDIVASVDLYNSWFLEFAPKTFRETREKTASSVAVVFKFTNDLKNIDIASLKDHPEILQILRMTTAPPIARDRLIGLADSNKNLLKKMEDEHELPPRMSEEDLDTNLKKMCDVINNLLDIDIFPWILQGKKPSIKEKDRASTIIADRLCGAVANPIIRNAQEERQLIKIKKLLTRKGYKYVKQLSGTPLQKIPAGVFSFRMNIPAGKKHEINIPVDIVIQPKRRRKSKLPILIEAKSAGDFTNVNKRRKEEATKIRQLKDAYGPDIEYLLFLCGYFDAGYLGYEASEGIDWIWEHRIKDLEKLGL